MPIGRRFGQHEPLTTRLHNLVRSYPKGLGVLKEFIQNADDAEADEVIFVIDERKFSTQNMPERMAWMHRVPALLVYNNRPFSEADIEGIQNIGQSGKSNSIGKTGRFGLGFNACYNVTDVPSFFSRGELHYFDPHYGTIPDASLESPGRCFTEQELVAAGWSVLEPFHQFIGPDGQHRGTVFRLPFRGEEQCGRSEIKKEPYTIADALEAVSELQQMGSRMLLFLKHVRRLTVERWAEDGVRSSLLRISATNAADIAASRHEVNSLLHQGRPSDLLVELERRGDVYANCRHEYSVAVGEDVRIEQWRVIDGFFVDDHKDIIAACRRMIEHGEKAVPCAGVAWQLQGGRAQTGGLYCFLPVPMQTALPVLINGSFDLDDSRQHMFLDESAHGSARIRVDWNRTLLEKSVARAYVTLVMTLREDCGDLQRLPYYAAFPVPVANPASWEHWLVSAFYAQAAAKPLIRVERDEVWSTPGKARTMPEELSGVAQALMSARRLPIPNPALPVYIAAGFAACNQAVPKLTPAELRSVLVTDRDVNCTLEEAPWACLTGREGVAQVCRYCLSDKKFDALRGLPLAVDCRNRLRTIGLTSQPLYLLGRSEDPNVFCDNPEWFVDPAYAELALLSGIKSPHLVPLDDARFLQLLAQYIEARRADGVVTLRASESGAMSEQWLCAVYSRLGATNVQAAESALLALAIVPDQRRHLQKLGTASTPLIFHGPAELRRVLSALEVPLVAQVSDELLTLIEQFASRSHRIWRVTPNDLLDTLAVAGSQLLAQYEAVTETHCALLGYFSRDECLAELRKSAKHQAKLKQLRLFPCVSGEVVDLTSEAFVPMEFAFPRVELHVRLLQDGPAHKWRNLLLLLGVQELSRSRFIRGIILPQMEQLERSAKLETVSWLRDNLSVAQSEADASDLFDQVRQAAIVLCSDGVWRPPQSVYRPGSELAEAVFGTSVAFPDMDGAYAPQSERWLEFFRQLDMPTAPRLEDVVEHVKRLCSSAVDDGTMRNSQAVYTYLLRRVEDDLANSGELSPDVGSAVQSLSQMAWIPVQQEAGDLLCFKSPEGAYQKPDAVFFPRVGQLVASVAPIARLRPEPSKRVRAAMGFPATPPLEMVTQHFHSVLAICRSDQTRPKEPVMVRALGQLYRYFGGEGPTEEGESEATTDDKVLGGGDLEAQFADVECIWDQETKRFWRPRHVFAENVRYLEPWRRTIRAKEQAIERGYGALGRRQEPSRSDLKAVLEDVALCGERLSSYEVCVVVREAVRRIVDLLREENDTDRTVLVLTKSEQMVAAGEVFVADAPWYEAVIDPDDVDLLDPRLGGIYGIQHSLGLRSLASSIEQQLTELPENSHNDRLVQECSRLEALVRSQHFLAGLQRLFWHEGCDVQEDAFGHLTKIEVRCVQQIMTCLYLRDDGARRLLGDAAADCHWEHEGPIAFMSEKRGRYLCDDLAGIITRSIMGTSLRNLLPVVHMLKSEPSEIGGILDDLKVRRLQCEDMDTPIRDEVEAQEYPVDEETVPETESGAAAETDDTTQETAECHGDRSSDQGSAESVSSSDGLADGAPDTDMPSPRKELATTQGRKSSGPRSMPSGETPATHERGRGKSPDVEATDESGAPRSTASSTSSQRKMRQKRLVSYVLPRRAAELEVTPDNTASPDATRRLQIGETARRLLAHETAKGCTARAMAHENPGYDVVSECASGVRYIEVKGTEAAWGERGVALTPCEFFYARENAGRDFWLYVVEHVHSASPVVHEIHNPAIHADRFVLDGGWRDLGASATVPAPAPRLPDVGDDVVIGDRVCGTVESVLPAGRFPLVIYRDLAGLQQRKRLVDVTIRPRAL